MIKGTYIFYQDGKEIYRSPNVITKFGKRFITTYLAGLLTDARKDMAFGIDSTAATVDDTRLGFEFYRTPILLSSTDIQTVSSVTSYSIVYKATIPQDVAGLINEVGLYPASRISANSYDSKFISDFTDILNWTDSSGNNPTISSLYSRMGSTTCLMISNDTSAETYKLSTNLDLSGYSINDSIRLSYYKADANLSTIKLRFYSSNSDYYETTITPTAGTGNKITDNILMSSIYSNITGTPNKSAINNVGIIITPTSGNTTSVYMDGLRINDEDTFDPGFGIISRSVFASTLEKAAGRPVDVEYRLDLDF